MLPAKGALAYCVKTLVGQAVKAGWARFALKCDTEPAILVLKAAAVKALAIVHGKSIVPENPAAYESQSNGFIECGVREVKGVARSGKHYAEELHGIEIKQDSQLLPWLVRNAAMCISVTRRGPDGRTAYELRRGKPFRRKLIPCT